MDADLQMLQAVVETLSAASFEVVVVGGWGEALLGLRAPGLHSDVDLLVVDPDMAKLDTFVAEHGEIEAKRFTHRRAFEWEGTLVELLLAERRFGGCWMRSYAIMPG